METIYHSDIVLENYRFNWDIYEEYFDDEGGLDDEEIENRYAGLGFKRGGVYDIHKNIDGIDLVFRLSMFNAEIEVDTQYSEICEIESVFVFGLDERYYLFLNYDGKMHGSGSYMRTNISARIEDEDDNIIWKHSMKSDTFYMPREGEPFSEILSVMLGELFNTKSPIVKSITIGSKNKKGVYYE